MFFLIWMALFGLSGCALFRPPLPEASLGEKDWVATVQKNGWQLSGRIGIQGGHESWHGGLQWRYRPGYDVLKISGPFGQGGAVVEVRQGWIRLRRHDGQVQESRRPEELLRQILGVAVPLDKLHFWVLGIPAPGPAQYQYGPGQRLRLLTQSGWQIEYRRYQSVDSGVLPERLVLNGPDGVRVKLIIDRWEIGFEPKST